MAHSKVVSPTLELEDVVIAILFGFKYKYHTLLLIKVFENHTVISQRQMNLSNQIK